MASEEAKMPPFGEIPFTQEEENDIKQQLSQKLSKSEISYRAGPNGRNNESLY
jgi:recombination DNA repair RAD52 pathway protein